MPHPSGVLTAFARRDTIDKLMFGWVRCMTTTLPGVSKEKALAMFAKEFSLADEEFNIPSQAARYTRMMREFYEDQKTKE